MIPLAVLLLTAGAGHASTRTPRTRTPGAAFAASPSDYATDEAAPVVRLVD